MLPFKRPTFFCRLPNHDYDMAINLTMIMSYTSVALSRSDASFLAAICFFIFLFFLRLYSVRAAIDSDIRCSYTRLHPVQQTNLQLSYLWRVGHLHYAHTAVYWYSYTRYHTSAVLALYVFVKVIECLVYCTASLRICTLLHDQPKSVG